MVGVRALDGVWVAMLGAVRDILASTAMGLEAAEETAVQLEPAAESGGAVGDNETTA